MGWPGPMTHRQFVAWNAWLDLQWNVPARGDYYAMQAAAESRKGWVRHPNAVKLGDMVLKFGSREAAAEEMSVEEAAAASKARWRARREVAQRRGGGDDGS